MESIPLDIRSLEGKCSCHSLSYDTAPLEITSFTTIPELSSTNIITIYDGMIDSYSALFTKGRVFDSIGDVYGFCSCAGFRSSKPLRIDNSEI